MSLARVLLTAAVLLAGSPPSGAQIGVPQIEVISNYFSPTRVSIRSGETVRWVARNGGHAVQADDGRFRLPASGTLSAGATVEFTFTTNDEWVRFHCPVHPEMPAIRIGQPPATGGAEPSEIRSVPSAEFPTIGDALAGIPEGAAVELAAGAYDTAISLVVDGVILRGVGDRPSDVIVRGGSVRGVGITVRASGVRIENLMVAGFTVAGIALTDADRFAVEGVRVDGTLEPAGQTSQGIRVRGSRHGRISDVEVSGGSTAAIQIDGCLPCDLIVERSVLRGSRVALLARAAGSLVVRGSVLEGDVAGIIFSGRSEPFLGAHVFGNTLRANTAGTTRRSVSSMEPAPQVGIWLDGARHVLVEDNLLDGPRYGIAITGTEGPALMHRIHANRFDRSAVADLAWDGIGAGVCFASNEGPEGRSATSDPPMLETLYPCGTTPSVGIPMPLVTARVMGVIP